MGTATCLFDERLDIEDWILGVYILKEVVDKSRNPLVFRWCQTCSGNKGINPRRKSTRGGMAF